MLASARVHACMCVYVCICVCWCVCISMAHIGNKEEVYATSLKPCETLGLCIGVNPGGWVSRPPGFGLGCRGRVEGRVVRRGVVNGSQKTL